MRLFLLLSFVGLASLSGQAVCPQFSAVSEVGRIANKSLTEVSGLAASKRNPGVFWAHNDSGDVNRVFALTGSGARLGTFLFEGAKAIDWEDMAVGPGPVSGQSYLYVADTGNNSLDRTTLTIYRVLEPLIGSGSQQKLSGVEALPIQYPDGEQDVETLLVDPLSGDIVLITRDRSNTGTSRVYSYPASQQQAGVSRVLTYVASIASAVEIKGGDVSPDGQKVLLRRHSDNENAPGWMYQRTQGSTLAQVFSTAPCLVPMPDEPSGEALTFSSNGSGFYTISEGKSQPVYYVGFSTGQDAPQTGSVATPKPISKAGFSTKFEIQWQSNVGALAVWEVTLNGLVSSRVRSNLPIPGDTWQVAGLRAVSSESQSLLWINDAGLLAQWALSGDNFAATPSIIESPLVGNSWKVINWSDLDQDGQADILWHHSSGSLAVWYLKDGNISDSRILPLPSPGEDWRVVSFQDVDGNSNRDLVWQQRSTGRLAVWYLNSALAIQSAAILNTPDATAEWRAVNLLDMNADSHLDVLWQFHVTGGFAVWLLKDLELSADSAASGHAFLLPTPAVGPAWQAISAQLAP